MPHVDFDSVPEGFEALPAGTYEARKSGHELKDSKSSNFQYYSVEFTIDEGEFAGRKLWDNYSMNPKALFAMKAALRACQVDVSASQDTDELWDEADGAPVRLVVKQRTYKDPDTEEEKIQNDITKVLAPTVIV